LNPKNGDIYYLVNALIKVIECIPLKMNIFKVYLNPTDGNIYITNQINNTIAAIKTEKLNEQLYSCSLGS
jgi:hypothetical protein